MKNRISIPKEQFEEIEKYAKEYDETPREMVEHLLEAQLDKIRGKQVFYPGLKWASPEAKKLYYEIKKAETPTQIN
ncbi:MAG: hypothetical protein ABSA75_07475 [Candidatus Bathyarchaeia archaeon]|jgi:hypothetical protein